MRASFRSALLAASLLLASCSDNPTNPSGTVETYTTVTLEYYGDRADAVWGRSLNDVYITGSIIGHYDGHGWDLIETPNYMEYFTGIWEDSQERLCFIDGSTVFQNDGAGWNYVWSPGPISSYWIAPEGHAYAVGYRGHVWKLEDTSWSDIDSLPAFDSWISYSLAGDASDNMYALSGQGEIHHFDGDQWTSIRPGGQISVGSAWKMPGGPLYFTTWNDTLYEFRGSAVSAVELPGSFRPYRVFGNAPAEVFVEGRDFGSDRYTLRRRTASGWPIVNEDRYDQEAWGAPTGESIVGTYNRVLRIDDGHKDVILGSTSDIASGNSFFDMWGTPEDGIFVVGSRALHYSDGEWTDLNKQALTVQPAYSVWGTSRRNVWAVGDQMILHYDGSHWTWVSGANQMAMSSVWCDEQTAIAVGRDGTIMQFDGEQWQRVESGTTFSLYAVWGWSKGAFAAGEDGAILRFDGTRWRIENSPVDWNVFDLFGVAPNDIWAVGASAIEICHYDGRTWTPVDIVPFQGDCNSVWVNVNREVFISCSSGIVQHFDGHEWARLTRYSTNTNSLWGTPDGDLLVGGGAILRYHR